MALELIRITLEEDLQALVAQINAAQWDDANDIESYSIDALAAYLEQQDTVFIVCYLVNGNARVLAGMASARIQQKPYDFFKWLYIDEVDTCSNYRRQGVGTALMRELLELATINGCQEAWLGTEKVNLAADALYSSLEPDAVEDVIGYTFELD